MMTEELIQLINHLKRLLPDDEIELNDEITDAQIIQCEKKLGFSIPCELKKFYKITNGFFAFGREILPIFSEEGDDLIKVNRWEKEKAEFPIPSYYLPFSPNGRGDYYCFDLRTTNEEGICEIIFWQWDYSPFNADDIEVTNPNLLSWLKELIEEVKEELD